MKDAYIVAARRSAVGKAQKGTLAAMRPDDFAAQVVASVLADVPGLDARAIDDVIVGCAMPEAEQGMNVARILALRAGLPVEVPAVTVNRFCASGLEAIAIATAKVQAGMADVVLAGGAESMSLIPMGGHRIAPNPYLVDHFPDAYLGMGLTAEVVAERYSVSREDQDAFALGSHERACRAIDAGDFGGEIAPLRVVRDSYGAKGKRHEEEISFAVDEGPRRDTTIEALAKLRPAFALKGTVTAGNASQMSDGAAFAIVMSGERAKALGARPIARLASYAVAGVAPDEMGMGPVAAVPRALAAASIDLRDVATIELNEAFAAQALAVIRKLELDPARVNPQGGAIALGHPLGCTGAKLVATALGKLARDNGRYGLVTMCVGGGMGAAGIVERL
ncbi:MAG: acetyl-CoA C-acyltransferase [Acidobacteriota bacterium]